MFWLIKMSFAVFVWHCLNLPCSATSRFLCLFGLTESHARKQTFGISIYNKKLAPDSLKLSQIEQITEIWQQPKPAVTAAEQLEHQGKTPSLLDSPPLSHRRAGVRHTVHVVDMSSEASADSF